MDIHAIIQNAIQEDIGNGDHTSLACIPPEVTGKARLLVKEEGVIAGIELAKKVFHTVDPNITFTQNIADGTKVKYGDEAFFISGNRQSILKAERLALNFMQRMSGIATRTRKMVDEVSEYGTKVLDTRKTTPGIRIIEKEAVRIGGGVNHRMGLYDMIMIKDNHIDYAGGIKEAIEKTVTYLKAKNLQLKIEIESRNLEELDTILSVGKIDRIMLDNFSTTDLKTAVALIDGKYETEASGGITLETIKSYAACGVDYISSGALTHHIKSMDLSLKAM